MIQATEKRLRTVNMRNWIAIGICAASAAVGMIVLHQGARFGPTASTIGIVWFLAAQWSGKLFWLSQIDPSGRYTEAKRGISAIPPVSKAILLCSLVLLLAGAIDLFIV
jgi:hypothetical protein